MKRHLHEALASRSGAARLGQRGISLVIVMIFLVILSVLGISAMQGSSLSSRVARNESDRNLAFQAAEAALKDGENDAKYLRFDGTACSTAIAGCRALQPSPTDSDSSCTGGLCDSLTFTTPIWEGTATWSGAKSVVYGTRTGAANLPVVAQQPRYVIEIFNVGSGSSTVYRITAVGYGANTSSQAMVQSAFRKGL